MEQTLRVRVDVAKQRLEVLMEGKILRVFPISTSQFGLGMEEGSLKTPTGRFCIAEKIGADAAPGTVFRGRVPTGERHPGGGEEDAILTRILWLEGLDPENANTRQRYIYIHGTNREDLLGTPASHGCIRMANADIMELYQILPVGTSVVIG